MSDEVFVLLMIPIASLSLGLTLHLAVRPFFEALVKVIREPKGVAAAASEVELVDLRADVQLLSETVEALRSKVEFDRQLSSASALREGVDA